MEQKLSQTCNPGMRLRKRMVPASAPTALKTHSNRIEKLTQNANGDHFLSCREGRSQKVTLLDERAMHMFIFPTALKVWERCKKTAR